DLRLVLRPRSQLDDERHVLFLVRFFELGQQLVGRPIGKRLRRLWGRSRHSGATFLRRGSDRGDNPRRNRNRIDAPAGRVGRDGSGGDGDRAGLRARSLVAADKGGDRGQTESGGAHGRSWWESGSAIR